MDIDYFNFNSKLEVKTGSLLVSQPFLIDSYFSRSVILICEHNKNGSLGFQVNKCLKFNLNDISQDIFVKEKIYLGGPVNNKNIYFIHRHDNLEENSIAINKDIFFGKNIKKLTHLIFNNKIDFKHYKFFLGYSGWSSGQLENEIKDNSWIVIPEFDSEIIFSNKHEDIWKNILKESGGVNKLFSNYPIDPRSN